MAYLIVLQWFSGELGIGETILDNDRLIFYSATEITVKGE